jgi:PmbA protein
MERILALAKRVAEEAEVFVVSSEQTPIRFEANRLKHVQSKQSTTVALRIIKEGKIGYSASNRLDDSRELVDMAADTAQFGMPAGFEFPSRAEYPGIEVLDPAVEAVSLDKMIELGEDLVAAVKGHTPDIVCDARISRSLTSVRMMNSRGGQAEYRTSVFSLGVDGSLIRGDDMLFVGESQSSCHPLLDAKPVSDVVLRQLELARDRAMISSGTLPVVFTPNGIASALISPLIEAFNGKTVLQGASPLAGKLGQTAFDEELSLWDDPTVPYSPESRPCDDEGVPSQRTPLIEQGKLAGFLYDLQTAALAHTRSTGNGSRSRGGLPAPAPSAFIIAGGSATLDEMVGDMKQGLVIEMLMGADQTNILGGDFNGNVLLGYKVENGKIVGRVKDTMVSGNIYRVLKRIMAVGAESKWVGGFLKTPHLYCPALSVVSK